MTALHAMPKAFGLIRKRFMWATDCAWCGRRLRRPLVPLAHPLISHTICDQCFSTAVEANDQAVHNHQH